MLTYSFEDDKRDMSKNWKQYHIPCPCGKSSDAFCIDSNDWGKCFSCGKNFSPEYLGKKEQNEEPMEKMEDNNTPSPSSSLEDFKFHPHRGIREDIFAFFDVQTRFENDVPVEVGFRFANDSFQIRKFDEKKFRSVGDIRNAPLFAKDRFDPGAFNTVTIFEGAYDALAGYQMLGRKSACVSIKSAQSAKSEIIKDWDYLNSFKRIVICFDNDDPGNRASREVASLFDFNKIFKIKLNRHKDANEYLEKGESIEFVKAWDNSKRYTPDNIISSFGEIEKALEESNDEMIAEYPFKSLQEGLYGLHEGEVVLIKGLPGIGKTEMLRAIEHHVLKSINDSRIGIIHLEESQAKTIKGIATYEDKFPYIHPQTNASKQEILKAYKKAVGEEDSRVYLYESFDVEDENQFLDNVRFMVSGCGCRLIFFDHITWLATGLDNEDERKKLDRLSQKLKLLAKELKFCLIEISHINDDGKTRGSRNIANVADTIIWMTRDVLNPSYDIRTRVDFLVEKARAGGNTGPMGYAKFDYDTMMLLDAPEAEKAFTLPGLTTA